MLHLALASHPSSFRSRRSSIWRTSRRIPRADPPCAPGNAARTGLRGCRPRKFSATISSGLPCSLRMSSEIFKPLPARIFACVVPPTYGQNFPRHMLLWITITPARCLLCPPVSRAMPRGTARPLAAAPSILGEIGCRSTSRNATPSLLVVLAAAASTYRSVRRRTRPRTATPSGARRIPTPISDPRTARRPRRQTRSRPPSPSPPRRPRRATPLCPYTPSKSPCSGRSPTWVTTPRMCPRRRPLLLPPRSRRTSDRGTDSLYPHHLHPRPRLTRISNSLRRRRSSSSSSGIPLPSNLHIGSSSSSSNNNINNNSDNIRRRRCWGRRLCQCRCRCRLATALIPAGNVASESWRVGLVRRRGRRPASTLLC